MKPVIIVLIVLCVPVVAFAATLHVPSTSYPTIQAAINAAVNGDTVLVAPGTYVENIDFIGKAIIVMSSDGPEVTVIDGNQAGSVVTFKSGEGADSVLDGFSLIQGTGTFDLTWGYLGGGIYCDGSSPTITNNIVRDNSAEYGAGLEVAYGSSPLIHENRILNNEAKNLAGDSAGGGISVYISSATITNNIISKNKAVGTAVSGGGGICCNSSSVKIHNNTITENEAEYGGGILVFTNSTSSISNNIISANKATGAGQSIGGGIHVNTGSSAMIVNNMISGNFADVGSGIGITLNASANIVNNTIYGNTTDTVMGGGGGIGLFLSGNATVVNTILWNNDAPKGPEICLENGSTLGISYSDVEGGQLSCYVVGSSTLNWGPGMIDSDPLFVDEVIGDFHLTFNSPCRASGDNSAVLDLFDFEGDPRIAYGTVDMGADEFYTHLYWTGDATPGGNVEVKFVGLPGTSPVQLWLSSEVMDPPMTTKYGDWYLQFPLLASVGLGSIPSPDGVLVFPFTFPANTPTPLSLPFQAGVGMELTNLSVLEVK